MKWIFSQIILFIIKYSTFDFLCFENIFNQNRAFLSGFFFLVILIGKNVLISQNLVNVVRSIENLLDVNGLTMHWEMN